MALIYKIYWKRFYSTCSGFKAKIIIPGVNTLHFLLDCRVFATGTYRVNNNKNILFYKLFHLE